MPGRTAAQPPSDWSGRLTSAVQLLRPEVPVYARANDRAIAQAMHDFGADAVINPFDRFGDYVHIRDAAPSPSQSLAAGQDLAEPAPSCVGRAIRPRERCAC